MNLLKGWVGNDRLCGLVCDIFVFVCCIDNWISSWLFVRRFVVDAAMALLVKAGQSINALTGGLLMPLVIAFIASVLFLTLLGIGLSKIINR